MWAQTKRRYAEQTEVCETNCFQEHIFPSSLLKISRLKILFIVYVFQNPEITTASGILISIKGGYFISFIRKAF